MNVSLYAEVTGKIDSRKLYSEIKDYDVNVTDLGIKTLIYGEVSLKVALIIIDAASEYGRIQVTLN